MIHIETDEKSLQNCECDCRTNNYMTCDARLYLLENLANIGVVFEQMANAADAKEIDQASVRMAREHLNQSDDTRPDFNCSRAKVIYKNITGYMQIMKDISRCGSQTHGQGSSGYCRAAG